jgi:hypothetical protein
VSDLSKLGENAVYEGSLLAADRATARPKLWREMFERYAKTNPNNAAEVKEMVSKSRYSIEDVMRAGVMYASSGWHDPRAVAADMSKHTQAAKVERNRNIVGSVDVPIGPKWAQDTDFFEGVPGDAKTKMREMADKSGQDFVISQNPSQEEWLALADQMVRDNPTELLQIKALLVETWRNGGAFDGPRFQISDLARIYKSKLVHTFVSKPTAQQLLAEAKGLLQKIKAGGRFSNTERPVPLSESDRLRASVIDYRFSEAPLVQRDAAASLSADQRSMQLTQARLSALRQEGKLLLAHLQSLAPQLGNQRSGAAADLKALQKGLAEEQARVPSKTASNDAIVASWNAQILETQQKINNLDMALRFVEKAEQSLPAASPGDVKKIFQTYENLLNTTATQTQTTLAKIQRLLPLASNVKPLLTAKDFVLDAGLQLHEDGSLKHVVADSARHNLVRMARRAQLAQDGHNAPYGKGDNRREETDDARRLILQAWAQAAETAVRLGAGVNDFPGLGAGGGTR